STRAATTPAATQPRRRIRPSSGAPLGRLRQLWNIVPPGEKAPRELPRSVTAALPTAVPPDGPIRAVRGRLTPPAAPGGGRRSRTGRRTAGRGRGRAPGRARGPAAPRPPPGPAGSRAH